MPPTAEVNSKIERVVEGVESLAQAVVALDRAPKGKRSKTFTQALAARKELRDALADFLKPTLRLVSNARKAS